MIFRIRGNSWNQAPSDPADMWCHLSYSCLACASKGLKISIPGGMENLVSWALRQNLGVGHGVLGVWDANNTQLRPSVGWGPQSTKMEHQCQDSQWALDHLFWWECSWGVWGPHNQGLALRICKPKVPLTALIIKMGTSPGLSHLIFTDSWVSATSSLDLTKMSLLLFWRSTE